MREGLVAVIAHHVHQWRDDGQKTNCMIIAFFSGISFAIRRLARKGCEIPAELDRGIAPRPREGDLPTAAWTLRAECRFGSRSQAFDAFEIAEAVRGGRARCCDGGETVWLPELLREPLGSVEHSENLVALE